MVHGSMEGRPVDCDTTGEIFTPLHPNIADPNMFHCYFRWSVHGVKPIRVRSGQNKDQAAPQAVGLHVASGQENVQDSVKHFSCHLSDEFVSYPNSSCMISYDDLSRKINHIVIFFALMNI